MSITEEDIQILIDQTDIDKELAKKLLHHNRGDLVESIIQIQTNEIPDFDKEKNYEYKEEDDTEEERHLVDTTIKENLEEYRDIVDQKDVIYNQKSIEKEEKKKLQKKIEELKEQGKEYNHLLEKKPCNEELYFMTVKGNFNSILVL